jgi:hypothetical protein
MELDLPLPRALPNLNLVRYKPSNPSVTLLDSARHLARSDNAQDRQRAITLLWLLLSDGEEYTDFDIVNGRFGQEFDQRMGEHPSDSTNDALRLYLELAGEDLEGAGNAAQNSDEPLVRELCRLFRRHYPRDAADLFDLP